MADDYYSILGVNRDASQSDIQKAYLKLARKYHPDVNPDDKNAKKKFQEIQQAFDVLKDPSKREMYDRYGSSFENMAGGGPRGGGTYTWQGAPEEFDFAQFFGERFGGGEGGVPDFFGQFNRGTAGARAGRRGAARGKGHDLEMEVHVPLRTAVSGGEVAITLPRAGEAPETLTVKIPAGVDDGKKIRLRGQGQPGPSAAGDLFLIVRVDPHPYFQRRGDRLDVKVPITLREAVEGARVDVPTPRGTVTLKVPPGANSGTRLRIKGHGVPTASGAGDLYAELQIVLPSQLSDEERGWLEKIDQRHPSNPRADLAW